MQSIGERLEEARKRKGVTIREAAEATKIRGDYLNSFESNNFSINVPEIYVRGFLRSYSSFLKLNPEKIITDYNANLIGEAKAAKRDHREFFGRMELQQPPLVNTEESSSEASTPLRAEADDEAEDAKPNGIARFLEKIDKEVAIKFGIVALVALLLILLIVWIVRALTSGGIDEANTPNSDLVPAAQTQPVTPSTAPAPTAAETETIYLVASGDVRVTVTEVNGGRKIIDLMPLQAGQRLPIEKSGPVRIDYSAGENLQVEIDGTLYGINKTGPAFSTIR